MRIRLWFVWLIVLSACAAQEQVPTPTPASTGNASSTPTAQSLEPQQFATNGAYVVAKHAADFKVDPANINIISDEEVEWSSSALGCPKPDMMYMDVMTSGFQVVIQVDGVEYDYHAGNNRRFFLCQNGLGTITDKPTK